MPSRVFTLLLLTLLQINPLYAACPTNWTVLNRDCCSSTVGFNSTAPTFHLTQGIEYPVNFIVWNDSSHWSLGIDTDWTTLNIFWGQQTGYESAPFSPNGPIDVVRIFYQPGKGLYGLQFHDLSGFSPVLGLATSTYVNLEQDGLPFSGWGVITHQAALLNSIGACFRME